MCVRPLSLSVCFRKLGVLVILLFSIRKKEWEGFGLYNIKMKLGLPKTEFLY